MDSMDLTTAKRPNPLLRRRNSIATSALVPSTLTLPTKPLHAASFPTVAAAAASAASTSSSSSSNSSSQPFQSIMDFELIFIKPLSYTSLKDLLPSSAVNSPTSSAPAQSGYEISIRNRLVKQAAWAYLQPMSTSPGSGGRHFLCRLRSKISSHLLNNPFTFFLRFLSRSISRAFDHLLRSPFGASRLACLASNDRL
ncbi:hypothetical protein TEA_003173 [Camellia sinensis var. sinensis]|uniref:Uncharacterized protein n=1 Tax=Camellia sinensis var. sinensis TaxID=542762 RepID=A0A4S4EVU0_CAMSN|nr:hypothetical protein TEA_003173 [Camellia sinensis var. sinensis]